MTTLQLPVPEAAARRFRNLSEQQTLVSQLLADCLAEPTILVEVMDYLSFKAEQRGLTPEALQRLIDKE
jgi:type IV secretory pathway VirD2 relaxase